MACFYEKNGISKVKLSIFQGNIYKNIYIILKKYVKYSKIIINLEMEETK